MDLETSLSSQVWMPQELCMKQMLCLKFDNLLNEETVVKSTRFEKVGGSCSFFMFLSLVSL